MTTLIKNPSNTRSKTSRIRAVNHRTTRESRHLLPFLIEHNVLNESLRKGTQSSQTIGIFVISLNVPIQKW